MAHEQPPPASEIVQLPGPSWAPPALAIGLAVALVGAFAGWVYAAIGGIAAVVALWVWFKRTGYDVARLPAEQDLDTAVLPPLSTRRADGRNRR